MPGQQIDFTIDDSLIPDRTSFDNTDKKEEAGAGENDTDSADGV